MTPDGRLFADYRHDQTSAGNGREGSTTVVFPVMAGNEKVGSLRMGVHYRSLGDILQANALIVLLISAVSFFMVWLLTRWMNVTAFRPVERLVSMMYRISKSGDYSFRLDDDVDPDFDLISSSFNQMLDQVEQSSTQLSESAAALRTARDEADAANLAKSQFLANMSHELRTPLNAIIGYAEVLREELAGSAMARSAEDIEWIHSSAHQLLTLINSILDLSKIEAGKMDVDIHEFDPARVLKEVSGMLEPIATQRGNQLQLMVDPSLNCAHSDSTKLRQCLLNLGSNACKFTENGQIFMLARAEGDDLVFSVSDTGIGMAPEELDRLFQPFMQADASTTRHYGGTGLGLTITWRFAEMLGGSVEVTSEPGQGSTFTLRIARDLGQATPAAGDTELSGDEETAFVRSGTDPLALVIEDEPGAAGLLARLARRAGYQTIMAGDGATGLTLARRHKPDLIMLDLGLPQIDGWQVLDALEEDADLCSIPTVVVSVDDDRRKTLAAGAAEHLVKPVNQTEMNDILRQYASKQSGRVLIVEDDAATSALYDRGLSQMGYSTQVASSGDSAMKALEEADFGFVITDLRMPDGDGFSLIEQIARMPDACRPKIIVVTGKVLSDEENKQLDGKVVRLLPKNGLSPGKLASNVHEILARSDSPATATRG